MHSVTQKLLNRTLIPLVAGIVMTLAGNISAQAQSAGDIVDLVSIEVRTGGDNLRGGNDNADVSVLRRGGPRITERLNRGNRELKNYTTTVRSIEMPAGVTFGDLLGITLRGEGFTGGFDGDNWNVDGIHVSVRLQNGTWVTVINENASPLLRFTGDNKFYVRSF